MSIIYTVIANKTDNVLCDYSDKTGNFEQFTRIILKSEIEPETIKALQYQQYTYHYINENKITFLVFSEGMSDISMISYLKDIKKKLYKEYDYELILNAQAYQIAQFSKIIEEISEYYKEDPRRSVDGELIENLNEAKQMLMKNVTELLNRGQKIDIIVKKAESLKVESQNISKYVRFLM